MTRPFYPHMPRKPICRLRKMLYPPGGYATAWSWVKRRSFYYVGDAAPCFLSDPFYISGMETLLERITSNPRQCGGRPCIRGMRIRVSDVLDLLAAGLSMDQILQEMPDLEMEDIKAALAYARRRIDHPSLVE
jgi:uncharacterized protein (DUF433 family)